MLEEFTIPKDYRKSNLAPTDKELQWMFAVIRAQAKHGGNALEMGAGVTSLVIQQAMEPATHIAIEDFKQSIERLKPHVPQPPRFGIFKTWDVFSKFQWDLAFIDSSVGGDPNNKNYQRHVALMAVVPYLVKDALVIIHDWLHKGGKQSRLYLESKGWDLLDGCYDGMGVGVYRRPYA